MRPYDNFENAHNILSNCYLVLCTSIIKMSTRVGEKRTYFGVVVSCRRGVMGWELVVLRGRGSGVLITPFFISQVEIFKAWENIWF